MSGRVTAIRVQKNDSKRANVFVDEEFAFGLAMIEAAKLSKGQYLTDEEIAALRVADEKERAYEQMLNFLSYRPRSKTEVARRLRRKGFSSATVDAVLDRLSRAGLVDDEAFVRYWIENREQFKPRGRYALRHELRLKGIDDRLIDPLLNQVDETGNAYRVAVQRLRRWKDLEPDECRRKLAAYLGRKGFGYETIQAVWERISTEHMEEESDIEQGEHMLWDQ